MESSEALAAAFGAIERLTDRPLWLVTAAAGGRPSGLIATFVGTASIVPDLPRVLAGIGRRHQTWERIEQGGAFALHLLGEDRLDWVLRFGLQSGRSADKFAGLGHRPGRSGSPILDGAAGWLDCRVEARMETGDRTVYLAEVLDARAPTAAPVLTVDRMLALVPDEVRGRLDEDRARDAEADARAIRAWRASSGRDR